MPGQAQRRPARRGQRREREAPAGAEVAGTPDDVLHLVEEGRARGYQHFNVKVAPDPKFDLELCRIVKRLVPDGFLWADANGGYDEATALATSLAEGPTFGHAMTKTMLWQEWNSGLGECIEAEAQAQHLRREHGVVIAAISAVTRGTDTLLVVDCVSSVGAVPFETDVWGVDVAVTASQKALMSPPGMAFLAIPGGRGFPRARFLRMPGGSGFASEVIRGALLTAAIQGILAVIGYGIGLLGIVGVNLVYGAFHYHQDPEKLIRSLVDHVGIGGDVLGPHLAWLRRAQGDRLRVVDVHLEGHALEVEDEIGRVLHRPRDRGELVEHAVDLHCRDGGALDGRQQDAPHGIANRRAETALERLRGEPAERRRERCVPGQHDIGFEQYLQAALQVET